SSCSLLYVYSAGISIGAKVTCSKSALMGKNRTTNLPPSQCTIYPRRSAAECVGLFLHEQNIPCKAGKIILRDLQHLAGVEIQCIEILPRADQPHILRLAQPKVVKRHRPVRLYRADQSSRFDAGQNF